LAVLSHVLCVGWHRRNLRSHQHCYILDVLPVHGIIAQTGDFNSSFCHCWVIAIALTVSETLFLLHAMPNMKLFSADSVKKCILLMNLNSDLVNPA